MPHAPLVLIVADGLRPDTLDAAISARAVPALARLRDEGGAHSLTTCFPSVTGLAYAPFLMGKHPADVGLTGLRWLDRSHQRARIPAHARSYVGGGARALDGDLDPASPTLFELAQPSLGAMSLIMRGLAPSQRIARGYRWGLRGLRTHFFGSLTHWLDMDADVADIVAHRVRHERPRFTLAALLGIDKASHARGHASQEVTRALEIVDRLVARLRTEAQADGVPLCVWVVSDHGHAPVTDHDELADVVRATGERVIAHPWVIGARGTVAVMVGGNAMAQLYLEPGRREAPGWSALASRWQPLASALLERPSVDLLIRREGPGHCSVHAAGRGHAIVRAEGSGAHECVVHEHASGDPLNIPAGRFDHAEAWHAAKRSAYPDALVQLARLMASPRVGDLVLSAAPGWDFRARYEPTPHVSTHGALHRDQMRVPLLLDAPPPWAPRRTTDVMTLAREALGIAPNA